MHRSRVMTGALSILFLAFPLGAQTLCSLPYYPVAVGDVNEYRTTSKNLDAAGETLSTMSTVYREEVTVVEPDHYRTTTTTDGNATESDWICSAEGLSIKLAEFPGMTVRSTGVAIPATMTVGDTWTQTFESSGEGFSQKMTTVNRVAALEKVTVTAGTFDALRVDYEIETVIPGQASSVIRGTQWFAPGTGLVRSTSVVPMEGEIAQIESTIELTRRSTR